MPEGAGTAMKLCVRIVAHCCVLPAFLIIEIVEWLTSFDRCRDDDYWRENMHDIRHRTGICCQWCKGYFKSVDAR